MSRDEVRSILRQIHTGRFDAVREYHRRHPELHWKDLKYDATGDTILHVASRLGHSDLVQYLMEEYQPVAVDCRNKDNKTALHEAAQFARTRTARILIAHGANVNALKKADWTPLMLACTKIQYPASYDTARLLLENGALINCANKDGWTGAHLTARDGCVKLLQLLIDNGVDLHKKSKNGRTALHIATLHGNLDTIRTLISKGIDVNSKDMCGNTPLHEAALGGDLEVFKAMVEAGCDVANRNRNGYTILHLAAACGSLGIIGAIMQESLVDVDCAAFDGVTPLHCAARKHEREAFDLLLEHGAQESLRDHHNRLPHEYFSFDF